MVMFEIILTCLSLACSLPATLQIEYPVTYPCVADKERTSNLRKCREVVRTDCDLAIIKAGMRGKAVCIFEGDSNG